MHPVAKQLNVIGEELRSRYLERGDAVEALLLAVLAKQHAFILGPPGTAKSALARDLLSRFEGSSYFEVLLSKTRPDQAVLGPYDLPLLRERGEYRRRITGRLLDADFAMIDEIGKMSPTLGHDLLAALNERIRHEVDDGGSVHPIPLYSAITASNELPTGESDDAAALWDRLLVRVVVDYIAERGNFAELLRSAMVSGVGSRASVPFLELAGAIDDVVPAIVMPMDVTVMLLALRDELSGKGIRVSDRRWRQSVRVLQAAAFLAGRDQIVGDDLGALRFVLWDSPEQVSTVHRAAMKMANPMNEQIMLIFDEIVAIQAEVRSRVGKSLAERAGYGSEALAKLKLIARDAKSLRDKHVDSGRPTTRVDDLTTEIAKTQRLVLVECLETEVPEP